MSNGSLILVPKNPAAGPKTVAEVVTPLGAIGFLGAPLEKGEDLFRVGERFLQLISFVGCSPYLQLEPPASGEGDFCHIAIHGPFASPRLLLSDDVRPPRCPACKATLKEWRQQVGGGLIGCSECGAKHPLEQITWGKNAGYGRLFLEIRNIFPGEAIPVAELMNRLQDLELGEWKHFYLLGRRQPF
jgi:hypothetical protein